MRLTRQKRHVCIGDVHGERDGLVRILKRARLVNKDLAWKGGDTILVQTGDVIDRGPDSEGCVELLRNLQLGAQAAGGQVIRLVGNHELMILEGNFAYVDFENREKVGQELRDDVLTGRLQGAFTDGIRLFTHAGLRPKVLGILLKEMEASASSTRNVPLHHITARMNQILREGVQSGDYSHPIFWVDPERGGTDPAGGIFWGDYDELCDSPEAWRIPQIFGHTPAGEPEMMHCWNGALVDIDLGISGVYGGHLGYLEIRGGSLRAITLDNGKWAATKIPQGT